MFICLTVFKCFTSVNQTHPSVSVMKSHTICFILKSEYIDCRKLIKASKMFSIDLLFKAVMDCWWTLHWLSSSSWMMYWMSRSFDIFCFFTFLSKIANKFFVGAGTACLELDWRPSSSAKGGFFESNGFWNKILF